MGGVRALVRPEPNARQDSCRGGRACRAVALAKEDPAATAQRRPVTGADGTGFSPTKLVDKIAQVRFFVLSLGDANRRSSSGKLLSDSSTAGVSPVNNLTLFLNVLSVYPNYGGSQ
jgi:hypothetical protein